MNRDEAIEAGAKAIYEATWRNADDCRAEAAAVLDAIGWRPESAVKAEALREAASWVMRNQPAHDWRARFARRLLIRAVHIERGDA